MIYFDKQKNLFIAIVLIMISFTSSIVCASYTSVNNSKQEIPIYNNITNKIFNLEKTPDEIARNSEANIIHALEQSIVNKK